MQIKLATLAQALLVAASIAVAPVAAFAQTASTPAAPAVTTQPAKPAVTQPGKTPVQTAEAACAVHKKDSKEFKECVDKSKAAVPSTTATTPAKKS